MGYEHTLWFALFSICSHLSVFVFGCVLCRRLYLSKYFCDYRKLRVGQRAPDVYATAVSTIDTHGRTANCFVIT